MLRKRVITALWGIPLVILAVWFDGPLPWFTILAAIFGLLATIELYRMTGVIKARPLVIFGLVWTLLFIIRPHCPDERSLPVLLTAGVALSLVLLIFTRDREGLFRRWAWMTAGTLYVGWLLGLLVTLRLGGGREWIFLALFVTFACDTAAYFYGKAFGRHKLAPDISPGKSWEGAVAGVCGGVVISALLTLNSPLHFPASYGATILLGILISIAGQLGDLAESLLKRNTGVKDSGGLMPGHGGLLDRLDSILFAGVVVYLYYLFFV